MCFVCLGFSSNSHGYVTITSERLQLLTYNLLGISGCSLTCHTYCDTDQPLLMVISERPVTHTPVAERLAVELSITTCFNDLGLSRPETKLRSTAREARSLPTEPPLRCIKCQCLTLTYILIFFFLKNTRSHFFKKGGDADTNSCVAGALLGCKLGLESIPESWRTKLKHRDWLEQQLHR